MQLALGIRVATTRHCGMLCSLPALLRALVDAEHRPAVLVQPWEGLLLLVGEAPRRKRPRVLLHPRDLRGVLSTLGARSYHATPAVRLDVGQLRHPVLPSPRQQLLGLLPHLLRLCLGSLLCDLLSAEHSSAISSCGHQGAGELDGLGLSLLDPERSHLLRPLRCCLLALASCSATDGKHSVEVLELLDLSLQALYLARVRSSSSRGRGGERPTRVDTHEEEEEERRGEEEGGGGEGES
mmetsp:Transcript_16705/g.40312  ORF Transcript_16705/g.40312 Transcript_16705/m.40312 type:complete len:239 (+) Transcript_16705:994-1710(+)